MLKFTKEHEWLKLEGDVATVGITHHAAEQLGDLVFVELPEEGATFDQDQEAATVESVKAASDEGQGKLGLALRPLQPEEKKQIGVDAGLLVAQASGPAAAAGITEGDVLLSINGVAAGDVDAVRAAVAKADKTVAVLIWRDGNKIFVPVRLG